MLKPSEIIRIAMNHPSYLAEDGGENWLCGVITCKLGLTSFETEDVREAIMGSLGTSGFLRPYLVSVEVIPRGTSYQSQEYKQAAFKHWNKLIEKLEKEGK